MLSPVILAAGESRRMGSPKALLPDPDGRAFIARIVRTLSDAGLTDVLVVTGTHHGPGLGVKATGAPIEIYGVAIAAIRDGQVQEGWNCFDFMSLYQQVGMLPALPAAS